MAIVFKTPKSTLNTTSKQIQNLGGDCPPCPEPVLEGKELNYTQTDIRKLKENDLDFFIKYTWPSLLQDSVAKKREIKGDLEKSRRFVGIP